MEGKRVFFYDPERKACRIAERAIAATGSAIETTWKEKDLLARDDLSQFELLIWHFDPLSCQTTQWQALMDRAGTSFPKTKLLLHVSAPISDYIDMLAERPFLRNLIAKAAKPLDTEELVITSEKILRNDLFGVEKYLMWGIHPETLPIRDSRDKPAYVSQVAGFAARLGCAPRVTEMVETVVDELVTNAIYNAPHDAKGKPKYAHLSRRHPVELSSEEEAHLSYASDGRYFCVAQSDRFGMLTRDTVISYLARCLKKGPSQIMYDGGGAGLGLFRVVNSLSKFIVNIEPGRRTEAIALIDLRINVRQVKGYPKSLHVFVSEG